jgi:signal transduction histidine kinase
MDPEQQQARETLDLFVSVLGHDLRDPLAAVMAAVGVLLQRGELTEPQKRNILRIKSSSERMARMIADVLDFARSRSGQMSIHPVPANLHTLCRQVTDELRLAHPEQAFNLTLGGNPMGFWDGDRLAQVVSNLLSNACRYNHPGSPIVLSTADWPGGALLSICNDGPPISQEKVDTLFDPFSRGDLPERANHGSGLGLGLYIVRSIVQAHQGRIFVRSHPDDGTTFTIQLPRYSMPEETQEVVHPLP